MKRTSGETNPSEGKTREQVIAEREAKKLAKQMKKMKVVAGEPLSQTAPKSETEPIAIAKGTTSNDSTVTEENPQSSEKTREQILAERANKKAGKKNKGKEDKTPPVVAEKPPPEKGMLLFWELNKSTLRIYYI